jgi:uncharacterized protein YciW
MSAQGFALYKNRVSECLGITDHASVEDHLRGNSLWKPETGTLQKGPIFKEQTTVAGIGFHAPFLKDRMNSFQYERRVSIASEVTSEPT